MSRSGSTGSSPGRPRSPPGRARRRPRRCRSLVLAALRSGPCGGAGRGERQLDGQDAVLVRGAGCVVVDVDAERDDAPERAVLDLELLVDALLAVLAGGGARRGRARGRGSAARSRSGRCPRGRRGRPPAADRPCSRRPRPARSPPRRLRRAASVVEQLIHLRAACARSWRRGPALMPPGEGYRPASQASTASRAKRHSPPQPAAGKLALLGQLLDRRLRRPAATRRAAATVSTSGGASGRKLGVPDREPVVGGSTRHAAGACPRRRTCVRRPATRSCLERLSVKAAWSSCSAWAVGMRT